MLSGDTVIIALRGWHPAIARAEANAMFSDSEVRRTDSRRLLIAKERAIGKTLNSCRDVNVYS